MATSWQERFERSPDSYIKTNDKKFADLEAGTTVLIPSARDIQVEIGALDTRETLTLSELRNRLAARHQAEGACPVMTGMNLRIVAELSFEALDAGVPAHDVVPVWKVVDPRSSLAAKLPGGSARLEQLRDVHIAERT